MTKHSNKSAIKTDYSLLHPSFLCSRTQKLMTNPMLGLDGWSYQAGYQKNQIPNYALKYAAAEFEAYSKRNLHKYYAQKLEELLTSDKATWALALFCPLTGEKLKDPVTDKDGITYERKAIEKWLRKNSNAPFSDKALTKKDLIPNHNLKMLIDDVGKHFVMDANEISKVGRLKRRFPPIIKANSLYQHCYHFISVAVYTYLAFAVVVNLIRLYVYFYPKAENDDSLLSTINVNAPVLNILTESLGQLIIAVWASISQLSLLTEAQTPEEKKSFADCIPYNEKGELSQCYPAWRYAFRHGSSYLLFKLCKEATMPVCAQTAADLGYTEHAMFRKFDKTYESVDLQQLLLNSPIGQAAWDNNFKALKRLVSPKNVNIKNKFGLSPLICFMLGQSLKSHDHGEDSELIEQSIDTLKFLLKFGANLHHIDTLGRTALEIARENNLTPLIKILDVAQKGLEVKRWHLALAADHEEDTTEEYDYEPTDLEADDYNFGL